jgi:hypothetical protein
MSALGTVLLILSTLLTALQATRTASVLFIAGLWMVYSG